MERLVWNDPRILKDGKWKYAKEGKELCLYCFHPKLLTDMITCNVDNCARICKSCNFWPAEVMAIQGRWIAKWHLSPFASGKTCSECSDE
jgi:hypothetical protein